MALCKDGQGQRDRHRAASLYAPVMREQWRARVTGFPICNINIAYFCQGPQDARLEAVMSDRIEKTVELKASLARVWRGRIDHREFGAWYGVELEGTFVVGETARGRITHPGYEHLRWEAVVREIEPERRFA